MLVKARKALTANRRNKLLSSLKIGLWSTTKAWNGRYRYQFISAFRPGIRQQLRQFSDYLSGLYAHDLQTDRFVL